MESRRENHRYAESGLPNVVLMDVEVRRCPRCGETAIVIPKIEGLHRALAMTLIRERGRLGPLEIRFLRKWLGWSGSDFARHMGVDPATVSRWERVDNPQPMGATAERLLRLAAAYGQPADEYPIGTLAEIGDEPRDPHLLGMRAGRTGWELSAA